MELIYQLFVHPTLGMRRASEERKLSSAFLVVILAILSNRIGWLLVLPRTVSQVKLVLSIGLGIDMILAFGILFLLTAIFHLVAGLSGGSGNGSSLYSVLSLALIPLWLITPLAITLKPLGKIAPFLFFPSWMIIMGWIAALFIMGIREVSHLSWGKTAATFILPLAGIGIALTVLFVLFLAILILNAVDIFPFFPIAPGL